MQLDASLFRCHNINIMDVCNNNYETQDKLYRGLGPY